MFDSIFSERGLSLDRLRVLVEVYNAGSIAGTSPGQVVRHSQYSRQLRELSEFFRCELVSRHGKVLQLTSEGTRLAELAVVFLRGLEDFRAECSNTRVVFSVAAGDSLIHWLVIPRIGALIKRLPDVGFATMNLRTGEIIKQVSDARVDFGLVRKNAVTNGMKSAVLGKLCYAAVIPLNLALRNRLHNLSDVFRNIPVAMQTTDGQFTKQVHEIARSLKIAFRPALNCQSFPQTLAAVRSGQFAAIVPKLAIHELPTGSVHRISDNLLRQLEREIVLVWNNRMTKVRPLANKVVTELQRTLNFEG